VKNDDHSKFKGFRLPTTTPIPDEIFDELMAELTGAELKVLLYICRRTFGFKKEQDNISLHQLVEGITTKKGKRLDGGTGLGKASVARAVKSLETKGIILRTKRQSQRRGDEPTTYALHMVPVSQNETPPVAKMRHGGVSKVNPQQTVLQQTGRQTTVRNGGENSGIKTLPDLKQAKEKTAYVAQHILDTLGDKQSQKFYALVAAKVPESVIRRTLAEIKADGAKYPERVFTYRMNLYALRQQKQKLLDRW
jgi:phage replication O-like protein O